MGRKSKVEQLPDDVLAAVNRALGRGATLDEVMVVVDELGHADDVSRSGLGRYAKKQSEMAAQLRHTRVMAEAMGRELGDGADDTQIGRVAVELLQSAMFKAIVASSTGETADFTPQEIQYLAKSGKEMMAAIEIDDRRRAKIRREVLEEAAAVVEEAATGAGWSLETARVVQNRIMGLDG